MYIRGNQFFPIPRKEKGILYSFIFINYRNRFIFLVLLIFKFHDIRSPGQIVNVSIPTFEALTQFGTARITTQNIGTLEASYSVTVNTYHPLSFVLFCFFLLFSIKETYRLLNKSFGGKFV